MNYVLIRTRLQALIASHLHYIGVIRSPFTLVIAFNKSFDEDDPNVYRTYEALAEKANKKARLITSGPKIPNLFRIVSWLFWSRVTGGAFYNPNLIWYVYAMALKIFPFAKIYSFDDGTANIQQRSTSYLSEQPVKVTSFRKLVVRIVFPKGAAKSIRKKIRAHYTIFPGYPNVVPNSRLRTIRLEWSSYLTLEDRAKIKNKVEKIMLGIPRDATTRQQMRIVKNFLSCVDLFIPHPRGSGLVEDDKAISFDAPAESIVEYCVKRYGKITLYHFNSSVAYSFTDEDAIRLVDLSNHGFETREDSTGDTLLN